MTREITTPIILAHQNIVPGSEIITVKGSSLPKLIRNSDYIMNYELGELRFLTDGAGVELADLIDENGLDIQYSYKIDFSNPDFFESQKEVFDEVAQRVSPFSVRVRNSPINDVGRVFNLISQEEYEIVSVDDDVITFSGINPPRVEALTNAETQILQSQYDASKDAIVNTHKVIYPSKYTPNLNPIVSLNGIQSKATNMRILLVGGTDFFSSTLALSVPLETVDVQLVTGSRTLRKSSIVLQRGTDYTFELEPQLGVIDTKKLTVNLTATAQQKIRTNSLYLKLFFAETTTLQDSNVAQFTSTTHPVNEAVTFDTLEKPLTEFFREVAIGDLVDDLLLPEIQVLNPDTGFVYEEGIDYNISVTQKRIDKIPNGRIGSQVLVLYKERKDIKANFTLVADIVLVDYVWGSNSINWSSVQKEFPRTEVKDLNQNQQFIVLEADPIDPTQVLIYFKDDFSKVAKTKALSYNAESKRLQVEPIPAKGEYAIEYLAVSQPIPVDTPYFVTYRYGADRRSVQDRFARLMGIESTVTPREEVKALSAGQTTTTLSRSPVDLDNIIIFNEGDSQETPIATPRNYDNISGTLTFTAVPSSGRKVIRYLTAGFDTASLRRALVALFENFNEGPTLTGYQNIIGGFVDLEPDITSGATSRFLVPNVDHTTGNQIASRKFESSEDLNDGSSSITFQPARFNLGALFETARGSFVRIPASSSVSLLEGTIEMLVGVAFDPNDSELHYLFDVGANRRNRISLYKSKQNTLNFDIWDNKGRLFRTSTDVSQIYFTEILNLKAGDTTAIISHPATPAQIDLDDNQTPDFYEGLETRFIIMPETNTFPPTYKKASIKVLSYDPPTRTVTFEPVSFSGRYVFSYVTGLAKYEETENFIAVSWKLHTLDGEEPFYKLYINGVLIINQKLADIEDLIETVTDSRSRYDIALYDVDVYEDNT